MNVLAVEIFGDGILSYTEFCGAFEQFTKKSMATAKRAHKELVKLEIIEECPGGYKRKDLGLEAVSGIDLEE